MVQCWTQPQRWKNDMVPCFQFQFQDREAQYSSCSILRVWDKALAIYLRQLSPVNSRQLPLSLVHLRHLCSSKIEIRILSPRDDNVCFFSFVEIY